MRTVFLFLLFSTPLFAATDTFYSGTARVLDLSNARSQNQTILLRRTLDPEHALLIEIACILRAGQKPLLSPVYMRVDGTRVTFISDAPDFNGQLIGNGTLQGPSWLWTYLHFSMLWPGDIRTEDDNYLVGKHLIAHKQISRGDTPIQLWDVDAIQRDPGLFHKLAADAHCPAF